MTPLRSLTSLILLALAACSQSQVFSGDGGPSTFIDGALHEDGGMGSSDGSPTPPRDGAPPGPDSGLNHDAVLPGDGAGDVWDGYIESWAFPSGSDAVHVVFDSASGDGPRTGYVVFGHGVSPPPATDPNRGYPTDFPWGGSGRPYDSFVEGFAYPIAMGSVMSGRIRLTARMGAIYEDWCRLQTPVPTSADSTAWGCLSGTGGASSAEGCWCEDWAGTATMVDCGLAAMCCFGQSACACDMTGCVARYLTAIPIDFNVVGTAGDGSVMIDMLHNVHLTKTR